MKTARPQIAVARTCGVNGHGRGQEVAGSVSGIVRRRRRGEVGRQDRIEGGREGREVNERTERRGGDGMGMGMGMGDGRAGV